MISIVFVDCSIFGIEFAIESFFGCQDIFIAKETSDGHDPIPDRDN